MPTDRSQLRSDLFRGDISASQINAKKKEENVGMLMPVSDGLSVDHLISTSSAPFDEAVSVDSEEEVPTPRSHVIPPRKISSTGLSHRLSPLDLCGVTSSSKFASFDSSTRHHRPARRNHHLPPLPASATSCGSSGGFLQSHNKAAFSSSGSLLGDLNGVPLFFMHSLSTMVDPLTGSLDNGSSNLSSNLSSPHEEIPAIIISDNECSLSPQSPQDLFYPYSITNKGASKIFAETIEELLPPIQVKKNSVESTTASGQRPKKKSKPKSKVAPVVEVSGKCVKEKIVVETVAPAAVANSQTPTKALTSDIVIDDTGFIEVTNKKHKVRANRQQQQQEAKVSFTRASPNVSTSSNGGNAPTSRGLPRRHAVARWIPSTDSSKVVSSSVVVAPVRSETITRVTSTELATMSNNKSKAPECLSPQSQSVNMSSLVLPVATQKTVAAAESPKTRPVVTTTPVKTDNQVVTELPERNTKSSKTAKTTSRTDTGKLSQQHHLLTDFMIGAWANFSKSLY